MTKVVRLEFMAILGHLIRMRFGGTTAQAPGSITISENYQCAYQQIWQRWFEDGECCAQSGESPAEDLRNSHCSLLSTR